VFVALVLHTYLRPWEEQVDIATVLPQEGPRILVQYNGVVEHGVAETPKPPESSEAPKPPKLPETAKPPIVPPASGPRMASR